MLGLIWLILVVVGGVLIAIGQRTKDAYDFFGSIGVVGVILCIIFGIGSLIIWPLLYFDSVLSVADMEAFQDSNRQNYSIVVEQTRKAIIRLEQQPGLQISVENLKQSTNWSERMKELRDKAVRYNEVMQRLRALNRNLWTNWLFADVPEELIPIILEE